MPDPSAPATDLAPVLGPEAAETMLAFAEPFSHQNVPGPAGKAAHAAALEAAGLRPLPPPFSHVVAILSDIDDSDRSRCDAYHGQLIDQLGLDFGDSAWLFGRTATPRLIGNTAADAVIVGYRGLGVLHPCGEPDAWTDKDLDTVFSYREMIAGFLRGRFDHFHSFMPCGPRMVWLERTSVEGTDAVFAVPTLERQGHFRTTEMRLAGLGVVGPAEATSGVIGASSASDHQDAIAFARATPEREAAITLGSDDETTAVLLPPQPPEAGAALTHLWLTRAIRVHCTTAEAAAGLRAIAVFNAVPELILGVLADLDQRWNVRTSLITEHSGYCFLNDKSLSVHAAKTEAEARLTSETARGWVIRLAGLQLRRDRCRRALAGARRFGGVHLPPHDAHAARRGRFERSGAQTDAGPEFRPPAQATLCPDGRKTGRSLADLHPSRLLRAPERTSQSLS
ncbi:MAG: hypothetical protein KF757_04185 [Phycisphaeraceae bacterium]|nr:hypothetical protein [Phycisphaeraceae bacterium]MCW5763201.1 hypothetical protein [Phycisphaeraceae bacterium]